MHPFIIGGKTVYTSNFSVAKKNSAKTIEERDETFFCSHSYDINGNPSPMIVGKGIFRKFNPNNDARKIGEIGDYRWLPDYPLYCVVSEAKIIDAPIKYAIREYRNNKDKYFPLVDHEGQQFESKVYYEDGLGYDVNLGWNCGFFGNRPYFYECWATDGITMVTVFISTIGLEDASLNDLEKFLIEDAKIYKPKEGYYSLTEAPKFTDSNGNEFYSLNIVVGTEDEPALIDGAPIYSFSALNELNGLIDNT